MVIFYLVSIIYFVYMFYKSGDADGFSSIIPSSCALSTSSFYSYSWPFTLQWPLVFTLQGSNKLETVRDVPFHAVTRVTKVVRLKATLAARQLEVQASWKTFPVTNLSNPSAVSAWITAKSG